jgi:hypothetical protein
MLFIACLLDVDSVLQIVDESATGADEKAKHLLLLRDSEEAPELPGADLIARR